MWAALAPLPLQVFKDLAPAVEWLERVPGAPLMPGLVRDLEAWLASPS